MTINRYGTIDAQETAGMMFLKDTLVEPRPYQGRITAKTVDMFQGRHVAANGQLEPNARSVMIESPTGSGKTVMGLIAALQLQYELQTQGHDLVIGWVAMRRNLLAQASEEIRKKNISLRNFNPISMFDKRPEALHEARQSGKKILLVVDEAQHDAASSMAHIHNDIEPEYILGLSATPFRTDRVKLCFDKVIKDAGIHALIQDGYLSKYHHYTISDWKPESVVGTYLKEPERWGKSAMYFNDLSKCYTAHRLLERHGVVSDVVTGETDVEDQLERFAEGKIQVLVNCMKLTEGWDEPTLQTCFVRDSGKGPTMQIGGRVFRLCKDVPVKQIVQSKMTRWPMLRTALPEQQFVWQNDDWASLTVNPLLNRINQNARIAISQAEVELPPFLVNRKKVQKLKF